MTQDVEDARLAAIDPREATESFPSTLSSAGFWRLAEESGSIGGFDRDLVTGYGRATPALLRLFDLSDAEFRDAPDAWIARIDAADRDRCVDALASARAARTPHLSLEFRVTRAGGGVRWLSARLTYTFDRAGRATRVQGVVQDVSDSRETSMANAHLAAVVAFSAEAIKSYTLDGRILSWNPAAERLFGYSAAEAIGQRIDMLVPADRREEARSKLQTVAAGGSVRLETQRLRKSGEPVEVSLNASPIRDASGAVVAVSVLAHDIGPRRAAQRALERYRLLSEKARDILFVVRPSDGVILETNAAGVAHYGRTREEIVGMHVLELRAPEARATMDEDLARSAAGDNLFETTHIRRDGSTFPVEVSAVSTEIDGERLILALVRDISERKEWARVQRLMARELLHRVKNSVAVIQSLVRLTAPRAKSLDDFVASLSGRLAAMAAAHDLLTDMHWRGADLAELVAKQLAPYLGADPRVRMEGPRVRLPQHYAVPLALALHELATNAAKHGSLAAEGGKVDLTWSTSGPRDEKLRIEWRESGGPPVQTPSHAGFGSTLIERGLPGAKVERRFELTGLYCSIDLDVSAARVGRARTARKA